MTDIKNECSEIWPIDDLRHCPDWLRISDNIKTTTRSYQQPGQKKKPTVKKNQSRCVIARAYKDGKEFFKGTYKEISAITGLSLNTVRNYASTGQERQDRYSFKVLNSDQAPKQVR